MADLHTEAAIWAEGTPYTADELIRGYNDWREYAADGESFEWWCEHVMNLENAPNRNDPR